MHFSPTLALLFSSIHLALATPVNISPMVIREVTDAYLFSTSMADFQIAKHNHAGPTGIDWSDDACSGPAPPGIFELSCQRHDFGYRNYYKQGRCSDDDRETIDDNFMKDMHHECENLQGLENLALPLCYETAALFYASVATAGSKFFCEKDWEDNDGGF